MNRVGSPALTDSEYRCPQKNGFGMVSRYLPELHPVKQRFPGRFTSASRLTGMQGISGEKSSKKTEVRYQDTVYRPFLNGLFRPIRTCCTAPAGRPGRLQTGKELLESIANKTQSANSLQVAPPRVPLAFGTEEEAEQTSSARARASASDVLHI